jgi:NitT/TauT family transport system substrate-binding protein
MRLRAFLALVLGLALVAAGCGGDDDDGGGAASGETTELTAVIPFPSGAVFYPLFVAQENGYFAEEGLDVTVEPVDGSGATLQQLAAGQADIALPSPGPFMQAVARGENLKSVYTLYQSNVFGVQVPAESEIQSLADLEGKTVGVGALDGGETPFVKAALSEEAGLEEGDYELLAVGDGGQAVVALDKGDIDAYAAAFVDTAIMRLRGVELRNILPEDFQNFFDAVFVFDGDFVDENEELIEGFGRAIAKATVWGEDNAAAVVDITSKAFPEEAEDKEFTQALVEETQTLYELPEEADGQWGTAVPEFVERYMDFLVDQGELEEPVDPDVFVNDHVEAYNDFDEDEVRADAGTG